MKFNTQRRYCIPALWRPCPISYSNFLNEKTDVFWFSCFCEQKFLFFFFFQFGFWFSWEPFITHVLKFQYRWPAMTLFWLFICFCLAWHFLLLFHLRVWVFFVLLCNILIYFYLNSVYPPLLCSFPLAHPWRGMLEFQKVFPCLNSDFSFSISLSR